MTSGAAERAVDTAATAVHYPEPTRRHLRIFALDPMLSRLSTDGILTLSVPYEPLDAGPDGELVRVVDYDTTRGTYYAPVELDDRRLTLQDGLEPSERDPRFHQQMVYAVTSALLENFERSLGRRFRWTGDDRLTLMPHAFAGRNAYFEHSSKSVRFGYFTADCRDPGRNLPGQNVYSCLSHDVIVHEVAHALVHRQREKYLMPTNRDVYAFHEGFADLLALFQHFSLPGLLEVVLTQSRADLTAPGPFVSLAQQFGESSGMGKALRSALDTTPDPAALDTLFEPHDRGAVLVAGVFDGFFATYKRAIADLLRIATGGTGVLAPGDVHPDLIRRVAAEAREIAARYLRMCIRAFQYLPPVDVTFGDFVRALVTADRDINPDDALGYRTSLVEGCRRRGIYPSDVGSLGEESIAYPDAAPRHLPPLPPAAANQLMVDEALRFSRGRGRNAFTPPPAALSGSAMAKMFSDWAMANRAALDLQPDLKIETAGFHAAFRPTVAGAVNVDLILQFAQSNTSLSKEHADDLGGIPLRGGTTVVADASGRIRRVISKPVALAGATGPVADAGHWRLQQALDYVAEFDGLRATPTEHRTNRVVRAFGFHAVDTEA